MTSILFRVISYNRGESKLIIRENYLKKIRPFYDVDLIKIITGILGCGKTITFLQIMDEIQAKGVDKENIIYLNFELKKYSFLQNDNDLYQYIKENMKNKKKYYIFLDEIQNVVKWELAINSLKAEYNDKISIFITGSNSDLLSSELATHIAGRYVSFQIRPFTFEEVCEFKKRKDKNKYELESEFEDYLLWGGMPQRLIFKEVEEIRVYLTDLLNSIIIKDIIERFKVKDSDLFNRILEYIITTPSQIFSVESIQKYFESENRKVTKNTIYNYLDYLCKTFLIQKVERYDVRGKKILQGKFKYYLTDLGLGQIMNTSKKVQLGAYLENVVYNELIYRGYDVKIGTPNKGEIDFIAEKDGLKEYYQVCLYVGEDEKIIDREFNTYKNIKDNYPKYVISMDKFDLSRDGIIHKNIIDWLLHK